MARLIVTDDTLLTLHHFWGALVLNNFLHNPENLSLQQIAAKFGLENGHMQSFYASVCSFSGMVQRFVEALRWKHLETLIIGLRQRLRAHVPSHLRPLMGVDGMTLSVARTLYNAGTSSSWEQDRICRERAATRLVPGE